MTLPMKTGPFFRDVDNITIWQSILPARHIINKNVRFPNFRDAGGAQQSLLQIDPIKLARTTEELAKIMNTICPQLAALEPIFHFYALRGAATAQDRETYRGLQTWNAFTLTFNAPDVTKLLYQDARNYAVFRLLGEISSRTEDDVSSSARKFSGSKNPISETEVWDIVDEVLQLRYLYEDHANGKSRSRSRINQMLDADPAKAAVIHGMLENIAGFLERQAALSGLMTMERYTVPICSMADPDAHSEAGQPLKEKFQRVLQPHLQQGDIGGAYHTVSSGDKLVLSFEATRRGALEAARKLAPRYQVYDAAQHAVSTARALVC